MLVGGEGGDEAADGVGPRFVGVDAEEADGPVGAEHEFVGSEDVEGFFEVGADRVGVDVAFGEFGDEPGKFHAEDVVAFGEFAHVAFPVGFDAAVLHFRFGDVIDDDAEIRLAIDELDAEGELALEEEEVVAEIEGGKESEATVKVIEEEVFVGLFLKNVADGLVFRVKGEALEILTDVFFDEGDPADDGLDEVGLVGEGKEPIGFLDDLAGLDDDGAFDLGSGGGRVEFGEDLVLREGGASGDPRVFFDGVVPEVVVGIEHGFAVIRYQGWREKKSGGLGTAALGEEWALWRSVG